MVATNCQGEPSFGSPPNRCSFKSSAGRPSSDQVSAAPSVATDPRFGDREGIEQCRIVAEMRHVPRLPVRCARLRAAAGARVIVPSLRASPGTGSRVCSGRPSAKRRRQNELGDGKARSRRNSDRPDVTFLSGQTPMAWMAPCHRRTAASYLSPSRRATRREYARRDSTRGRTDR